MAKHIINPIVSEDGSVTDAAIVMSDVTTNNASVAKHGFLIKLADDITKYLRSDGAWAEIPLSSIVAVKDFTVAGEIKVPAGDVDYICPMIAGSGLTLVGMRCRINSGTSATLSIEYDGTAATEMTDIVVTTTLQEITLTTPLAITAGKLVVPVVSAVSGSPKNMTVSLVFSV